MGHKQTTWTRKQWQDHRELIATVLVEVAEAHADLSGDGGTQVSPEDAMRRLDMPEARLAMALELVRAARLRAAGIAAAPDKDDLVSRLRHPAAGEDWNSLRAAAAEMIESQAAELEAFYQQAPGPSP